MCSMCAFSSLTIEHSFDGFTYSVRASGVAPTVKGVKISNPPLIESETEVLLVRTLVCTVRVQAERLAVVSSLLLLLWIHS